MAVNNYSYKVRDSTGRFREGQVKAASENAVVTRLRDMGYSPLEVKPSGTGMKREITLGRKKRVKLKDLSIFARQFATMIDSGLSLLRALVILSEQMDNPTLRQSLVEVKLSVEAGNSLSSAFAAQPLIYPPLMINMARAGESGGFLDRAMRQIAETFEADVRLRGKVKAAMTYPVVVFALAIFMCMGMLIFIVPIFEEMFAGLGSGCRSRPSSSSCCRGR